MKAVSVLAVQAAVLISGAAFAAPELTPKYSNVRATLATTFPDRDFSVWANAEGDLNGDGIEDLGLVITSPSDATDREERLIVLIGTPDGGYSILSVSDEFCHVRLFYNLTIKGNSLFVEAVGSISNEGGSGSTMQFRYNPKIRDLELIGREDISEEYGGASMSTYRVSINYLSGAVIHSRRSGNNYKELKERLDSRRLARLQAFDCEKADIAEPRLYIK